MMTARGILLIFLVVWCTNEIKTSDVNIMNHFYPKRSVVDSSPGSPNPGIHAFVWSPPVLNRVDFVTNRIYQELQTSKVRP